MSAIPDYADPPHPGLTSDEAASRRAAGQGNDVQIQTGRTYGRIVRDDVFNFINVLFFVLCTILLILGETLTAFVVVFVILANTVISLVQEIRAKRVMDRIAILMRPRASVLRDGVLVTLDPAQIVRGDVIYAHPGDQIVVDGPLLDDSRMEIDESLLTGESDLVVKRRGDQLLSGSFCMMGGGYYEAAKVGLDSFANKMTAKATRYRRELTPLQRQVNQIVKVLLVVVVVFEIVIWRRNVLDGVPFVESIRQSTVILALIPNGLVLSIALTYALGAVRLLGKDVLVQQFNAVESLSNVDTLCTDKTGTLTSGVIALEEIAPLGADQTRVELVLGVFAASTGDANKTIQALRTAYPAESEEPAHEALFNSARKWSGMAFAGTVDGGAAAGEGDAAGGAGGLRGTFVFGAPEMVAPALATGSGAWQAQADAWAARGLRVLLLAGLPEPVPFAEGDGPPELPTGLEALGLICFSDELRHGVRDTLDEFTAAGIEVKIISGDNPKTVTALATQAGVHAAARRDGTPASLVAVSGADLDRLSPDALGDTAERATVFGRVTPENKEDLVASLRQRGHYVAMVGDGVNDVIALKQANVAVGMQGGSQAARGVSDLILLKDTFAPLPYAFREGQRIINGMNDILRIFMVRIFFKASIIAAITALGAFPFAPRQASLVSFVSAGVPAVALAAWARPGPTPKMGLFKLLGRFVIPTALLLLLMSVGVFLAWSVPARHAYLAAHPGAGEEALLAHVYPAAQTALTLFASFASILLILFAVPPTKWFAGGAIVRGDWRFVGVVIALLAFVVVAIALPLGRTLFELKQLPIWEYVAIFALALLWMLLCHLVWRSRILDRWLGTAEDPGHYHAKLAARTAAASPYTTTGTLRTGD